MTISPQTTIAPAETSESMSPLARAVAIFVRPAQAWGGLREHAQWWIPLLLTVLVTCGGTAAMHQRAILPMMTEQWDQQVADGNMSSEQADKMEAFFSGPAGLGIVVGQQAIGVPLLTLFAALLIWFGIGFVLGTKTSYRLALEVASWSGLISLPGYLLTMGIAWMRQTLKAVHVGFGMLLPDSETPSKLQNALAVVLDGLGPLSLWYLVVAILGAAALSGAPRKSVAWVLSGIYLAMILFSAAMAAMFSPAT